MVLKLNFKGPMAPVFTPFHKESGDVNIIMIPKYAEYLQNAGVKGILVNGTAGEGVSMTMDERKLVLEEWMKVSKNRFTVMAQIGGRGLREVQDLAKHAEGLGVDALLCLPDLFFRPKTVPELVDYLKYVSDAAPKTSLFYYHIPAFTGVILDMPELLRTGKDKIPTLGGIKFTNNNLQEGADCLNINRNEFTVFLGNEQTLAGACILGFDCCLIIGLNLVPDLVFRIMNSVVKNQNKEALEYQNKFSNIINKISKDGFLAGTKAAMSIISDLEMGDPRPPMQAFNAEQLEWLKKELANLKLIS